MSTSRFNLNHFRFIRNTVSLDSYGLCHIVCLCMHCTDFGIGLNEIFVINCFIIIFETGQKINRVTSSSFIVMFLLINACCPCQIKEIK